MPSRITSHPEEMDSNTSRTICGAVGDRLRQDYGREVSDLPPALAKLLDAMRRQETAAGDRSRNGG